MNGGDTLTCGVCQKDFALADIVKFIQHKVLTCNKENYQCKAKTGDAAKEAKENGSSNAADSDSGADTESNNNNNNSTSSDSAGGAAEGDEASAASTAKENGDAAADKTSSDGEEAKDKDEEDEEEVKPDLESRKSPSSSPAVTSTPDSNARKRKADCVDADTNTIITGKRLERTIITASLVWFPLSSVRSLARSFVRSFII